MSQVCRACLTTKENFSHFLCENVPADLYFFCTSVEVDQDDLPKSLCEKCYTLIMKYSEFKRTCIGSQNALLSLKDNLKNENLNIVECNNGDNNGYFDVKSIDLLEIKVKSEDTLDQFNDEFVYEENYLDHPVVNKVVHKKRKSKKYSKLKGEKKEGVNLKIQRKHFIYSCELCKKKFNYRERFEAHKQQHEGKTVSIVCVPCDKTFMTWSGLRRHNENEHTCVNLEKLKCPICGKLSKSRQTLKTHQKIHGERSMLVCDVCGKGFTTAVILKTHLKTHKENRERRYTCEQCGKKFFTQSTLLTHVSRRHTGKRFICHVCSYPFTDKYNLSKHLLIHEGKKLYKCDVCSKSYSSQSTLVEHKRIHSGERPYSCNYCAKCFVSKRGLNEHIRTHTGEKPYKCEVCEQGFSQSGSLRRHLKIHERVVTTNS